MGSDGGSEMSSDSEKAVWTSTIALVQPFCPNLSGQKVCVLWDISHWCVCAVDEEGAINQAMMAPYYGHFTPSGGELLTAPAAATHTNKHEKSNVTVLTPQWTELWCRQKGNTHCRGLYVSCHDQSDYFSIVCFFWKMKELNEREGGINPLTSPQETEMSS